MGILFGFKARDIAVKVTGNHEETDSTVVITTPLTVDPISDAVNNVRFACNGFAPDGSICFVEMRTRTAFRFQIPQAGRITVHGHLTYAGLSTASARASSWLFDFAGSAVFSLRARMRVRVLRADDQIVFTRSSGTRVLFGRSVSGGDGTSTATDVVFAGLMEEFLTVAPPEVVLPEHRIFVRMQYNVQAIASEGGEFVLDFDATGGGGLNVPMVVVNF